MKILVLEDNERLYKIIKNALSKVGYSMDVFTNGEEVIEALTNGYHCFILDTNTPSLDGISVLETIRMYHKEVPVIIMSSNHDLAKIQSSYELGCDDYLKKPFFVYELIQKVKKLCQISDQTIKLWDGYIYDYRHHLLFDSHHEEIKLAKKEILFFNLFIKDPHRVVSFNEMEEYIWEGRGTTLENIRALIKRLRKKLPDNAIEIIKEIGYKLKI